MAWGRRTRTCRPSWSCSTATPSGSSAACATGDPASSRPSTRGRGFPRPGAPIRDLEPPAGQGGPRSGASSSCSKRSIATMPGRGASRTSSKPGSGAISSPSGCRPLRPRRWTWPARRRRPGGSTAWTTRRRPRSAGTACWRGGWWNAGVRFVQLYHGAGSRWDSHDNIERQHPPLCRSCDRPVAGLLRDLKRRGLLDETLVVWGGEFGRTPIAETNTGREGKGRDHNPTGFTMWMAGGGVKGGRTIGTTDELGLHAIEDRLHVLDLHATILHLMGVDASRLTYLHKGRPERPSGNVGLAYKKIAT